MTPKASDRDDKISMAYSLTAELLRGNPPSPDQASKLAIDIVDRIYNHFDAQLAITDQPTKGTDE